MPEVGYEQKYITGNQFMLLWYNMAHTENNFHILINHSTQHGL